MASGYEEQMRSVGNSVIHPSPAEMAGQHLQQLCLTVLFTTVTDTLAALHEAARLAHQLGGTIRILVPHVVPYPLPLDKPRVDPEFRLRHFRTLCEREPIDTRIDVQLCRDAWQCVRALPSGSLVVVGGKENWWPLSFRRRLTRTLKKAGHHVIAVGPNTQP